MYLKLKACVFSLTQRVAESCHVHIGHRAITEQQQALDSAFVLRKAAQYLEALVLCTAVEVRSCTAHEAAAAARELHTLISAEKEVRHVP